MVFLCPSYRTWRHFSHQAKILGCHCDLVLPWFGIDTNDKQVCSGSFECIVTKCRYDTLFGACWAMYDRGSLVNDWCRARIDQQVFYRATQCCTRHVDVSVWRRSVYQLRNNKWSWFFYLFCLSAYWFFRQKCSSLQALLELSDSLPLRRSMCVNCSECVTYISKTFFRYKLWPGGYLFCIYGAAQDE